MNNSGGSAAKFRRWCNIWRGLVQRCRPAGQEATAAGHCRPEGDHRAQRSEQSPRNPSHRSKPAAVALTATLQHCNTASPRLESHHTRGGSQSSSRDPINPNSSTAPPWGRQPPVEKHCAKSICSGMSSACLHISHF